MSEDANPEASIWLAAATSIAARTRGAVVEMSRQAESAVTRPRDPGGWPSQWRLAVSARIAALNGQRSLTEHYLAAVTEPALRDLADPTQPGRDARERIVLAFMDKVACEPRAVLADDIGALKSAGVPNADIVRLCELNAFMGYQCRVLAGLALLRGDAA